MSERDRKIERKKLHPIEGAGKALLYLRLNNCVLILAIVSFWLYVTQLGSDPNLSPSFMVGETRQQLCHKRGLLSGLSLDPIYPLDRRDVLNHKKKQSQPNSVIQTAPCSHQGSWPTTEGIAARFVMPDGTGTECQMHQSKISRMSI